MNSISQTNGQPPTGNALYVPASFQIPGPLTSTPPVDSLTGKPDPVVESFDLFGTIRRHFGLLIVPPLLFAIVAAIFSFFQTTTYKSSAVLMIDSSFDQLLQYETTNGVPNSNLDSLKSLEVAMVADSVILRVIDKLDLRNAEGFIPEKLAQKPELGDAELLNFLRTKRFKARLQPETRLITISVEDVDPERARTIARTFTSEFETFIGEQRLGERDKATGSIRRQANQAREDALALEEKLDEFRESHPQFPVEQDHDLFTMRLSRIGEELDAATRARLQIEGQNEAVQEIDPNTAALEIFEVAGYKAMAHVSTLLSALSTAESKLAGIENSYRANHPLHLAARAEVDRLRSQVSNLASEVKDTVAANYSAAVKRESLVETELEKQQHAFVAYKKLSSEFRGMKQEAEGQWALHQALQNRLNDSVIASEILGNIATVISEPMTPYHPAGPGLLLMAVAGGLAGCVVSGGFVGWKLLTSTPVTVDGVAEVMPRPSSPLALPPAANFTRIETSSHLTSFLENVNNRSIQISGGDSVAMNMGRIAAARNLRTLVISVNSGPFAKPVMVETGTPGLFRVEISLETLSREPRLFEQFASLKNDYDKVLVETSQLQDLNTLGWLAQLSDQYAVVVGQGNTTEAEAYASGLSRARDLPVVLVMADALNAPIPAPLLQHA